MNFLKQLRKINFNRLVYTTKIWGSNNWSLLEWGGALCGEAGELANILKKVKRREIKDDYNQYLNAKIPEISDELADIIIYADLIAAQLDIDLEEVIRNKFNRKSEDIGYKEKL